MRLSSSCPWDAILFGVAFTTDGKTALVSNHGDGTISVVDVAAGTVKTSFTAGVGIETLAYY